MTTTYLPNAGQTQLPVQDGAPTPTLPFTPLSRPEYPIPELALTQSALDRGWTITQQCQHFLPGVSVQMLDWWWANMEKGYYLWAPGSHKRFSWVRAPGAYGFLNSAHLISETMSPDKPPFGGDGVQINRLDLSWFPFTTHLRHVIVEGVFNDLGEFVDATIHMWAYAPGGCDHITAGVANTRCSQPPAFVLADPSAAPTGAESQAHAEYEASRWPVFLPTLYGLWAGHPDPSQNVACDLSVEDGPEGLYYLHENGPVMPSKSCVL